MTVLADLPEEILHLLFRYLPEKEILWNVGFTCLYLQHAVLNFIKSIKIELHSMTLSNGNHELATKQNLSTEKRKGCTENIVSLLDNEMITHRISYIAIGKIFNTFYEEQVVQEIKQNQSLFCSKSFNNLSTKVLFKYYFNVDQNVWV